jgi:hypothetical protein
MSMILGLNTLSDGSIDSVLAKPALIWRVVAPDDRHVHAEALGSPARQGFFARLFRKAASAPPPPALALADGEVSDTDLDKAWHGIHFLLTGSDWGGDPPLNFLVAGGTPVGDIDVGYGPARVFRSTEVAEIHKALGGLQEDDLRKRFQPDVMMKKDIYPTIWDRDPKDDDALGYLLEYFAVLKKFVSDAADKGLGIVVTLQ